MTNQERLKNLDKIDVLYNNNCVTCSKNKGTSVLACKRCPIGKEMLNLGSTLTSGRKHQKISSIIAKGQDMTRSEIVFLLENEYTLKQIRGFLDLSPTPFNQLISNWGLNKEARLKATSGEAI